jgi:hypothetical protein
MSSRMLKILKFHKQKLLNKREKLLKWTLLQLTQKEDQVQFRSLTWTWRKAWKAIETRLLFLEISVDERSRTIFNP